jgi:hypothetical protein
MVKNTFRRRIKRCIDNKTTILRGGNMSRSGKRKILLRVEVIDWMGRRVREFYFANKENAEKRVKCICEHWEVLSVEYIER